MLEVFLTFGIAYFLKRLGIFSKEQSTALVNYVLYFALPLLSFKTAHSLGLSKEVFYVGASAWLVIFFSLFLSYGVGKFMGLNSTDLRSFMMVCTFGNTAFLGYPYSFAYYSQEGLKYAIIYDSVGSFLAVSSIGLFLVSGRLSLRSLLLFPPFLGLLLGFLLKPYEIPMAFQRFIDFSTASLLPVILFSLGLSFELSHIRKEKRLLALAIFIKMVLTPLFAMFFLKLFPLGEVAYKVSVLESAMPTMIMASLLLLKYGLNHHLAFTSAGLGILISFITVPLWVYLL
ncbi:MAG: AEC family transporter [Aquificaceae bacterium]